MQEIGDHDLDINKEIEQPGEGITDLKIEPSSLDESDYIAEETAQESKVAKDVTIEKHGANRISKVEERVHTFITDLHLQETIKKLVIITKDTSAKIRESEIWEKILPTIKDLLLKSKENFFLLYDKTQLLYSESVDKIQSEKFQAKRRYIEGQINRVKGKILEMWERFKEEWEGHYWPDIKNYMENIQFLKASDNKAADIIIKLSVAIILLSLVGILVFVIVKF